MLSPESKQNLCVILISHNEMHRAYLLTRTRDAGPAYRTHRSHKQGPGRQGEGFGAQEPKLKQI